MKLSVATLKAITKQIEQSEPEDGWSDDQEIEVQQGHFCIFVTYRVYGRYMREYNYHSEVPYDCYEDMSHTDFMDAEITKIEAWDEEKEEAVEIDNEQELKY